MTLPLAGMDRRALWTATCTIGAHKLDLRSLSPVGSIPPDGFVPGTRKLLALLAPYNRRIDDLGREDERRRFDRTN